MLKKHGQLLVGLMTATDVVLTAIGWMLAYWIRFYTGLFPVTHGTPPFAAYLKVMPAAVLVGLLAYRACGLYRPRRTGRFGEEMVDIIKACVLAWAVLLAALSFYRSFEYSRLFMPIYFCLNPMLIILSRASARSILRRLRRHGRNQKSCLIVGSGRMGQELLEKLRRNAWTGIQAACFVDDRADRQGRTIQGVIVAGAYSDIPRLIEEHEVTVVFVALPFDRQDQLEEIAGTLSDQLVDLQIVPDVRSLATLNLMVSDFDGMPMLSVRESPLFGWRATAKRALDVVVSVAALMICSVPMLVIALLVKRSSPGPVFYKQERMGLDGRLFHMLKFRTMPVDAEVATGPVWARKGDTRRTGFGSFLRATSLDELPQFLNVLLGQMSVVGPRPERPVFIADFKKSVPKYMLRHKMKAGITGWAQVNGWRGNTSLEKRIQYDIYYIEHWSIGFDIRILFLTLLRGLVNRNAY